MTMSFPGIFHGLVHVREVFGKAINRAVSKNTWKSTSSRYVYVIFLGIHDHSGLAS